MSGPRPPWPFVPRSIVRIAWIICFTAAITCNLLFFGFWTGLIFWNVCFIAVEIGLYIENKSRAPKKVE